VNVRGFESGDGESEYEGNGTWRRARGVLGVKGCLNEGRVGGIVVEENGLRGGTRSCFDIGRRLVKGMYLLAEKKLQIEEEVSLFP
jgi:hypothetical protein